MIDHTHNTEPRFQVLLIEDNPGDANLVSLVMNHRTDILMQVVENVVTAFQFLQRRDRFATVSTPDLILLDLNLPIFSGKALLQERSRQAQWKCIPVVVFTSSARDREECLALGANDFVVKPDDWKEWNRTFDKVIAKFLSPPSL